jgi:peptide/nickel transport system permease protein
MRLIAPGIWGRVFWDADLVFTGPPTLRLPSVRFENLCVQAGTFANPLGTDGDGRDLLRLTI